MEIAKIVKYLQKDKYADFLSEICCMHFFQNYHETDEKKLKYTWFLKSKYIQSIQTKYNFQNEHMSIIQNLNIDSVVLANTEIISFFHYKINLPKPCSLRKLLEAIIDLTKDYYFQFIQELHLNYEDKNLILTCTYEMNFLLNVFIHYPESSIKPIISTHKASCINHIHDLLVDNILYAKKINGLIENIRVIYTVYEFEHRKFLQSSTPYDYQQILRKHYYESDEENITTNLQNIRL